MKECKSTKKQLEYAKKRSHVLREAGLCTRCRQPRDGPWYCLKCQDLFAKSARKRYQERRKAQCCVVCNAPTKGFSMCPLHRKDNVARNLRFQNKRKREGVCSKCGGILNRCKWACDSCADAFNKKARSGKKKAAL